MTLLSQLRRDRFDESEGSPEERAYKRGWNHHALHTERLLAQFLDSSDDGNAVTPAVRDSSDGLGTTDSGATSTVTSPGAVVLHAPPAASREAGTFSEAEYRVDAARVVAHAAATGRAVVVRDDGSPRVVISIPAADHVERGLAELVENAPERPVFAADRILEETLAEIDGALRDLDTDGEP